MDEELRSYLDARFAEVKAEIEAVETRLLSEFWKWGRTTDQRMRRLDVSDATTVDRITNLEDRVFALEREKGKQQ
jgi:hypothetical protein